jgi:hypothetical protein
MSKIIKAINTMIANSDLISNVTQGDMESECFFKYDSKHTWSIFETTQGDVILNYYPEQYEIEKLASIPENDWHECNLQYVTYRSDILGTKEAKDSLKELNSIVREKVYGMDSVLDDIINSGEL